MAGQAANLVSLEADLHVAMEKHELRLLFQPIVDLRTYKMVGAEALLRWRHPVESVLAPDKFLRIAEEAGLMVPITRWIILRVVRLAGEWLRRLPANQKFFISINLSPTALRDPGLGEYVASLLRETQLPPSLLKFELTEAALISNVGAARETLDRLHAMGIQLMLDDFGTGYSSLSYLQLFPFDFVKIDRPFVNRTGLGSGQHGHDGRDGADGRQPQSHGHCGDHRDRGGRAGSAGNGLRIRAGILFQRADRGRAGPAATRGQEPFRPAESSSDTAMVRPLEEESLARSTPPAGTGLRAVEGR